MKAEQTKHPNVDELKAFGLGKLPSASAETILLHVETCADCRRVVAESSGESLLGKLRAAQPAEGNPTPYGSVSGLASKLHPAISSPDAIPSELSNNQEYEITRELGRGGMGVVYLARNKLMGRDEVLKVMGRDLMAVAGASDRFRREIQSAARLSHPNIVRAFSAKLIGDLLVFSMEYVPGEELGKLIKARGPLPIVNACHYTLQVANGLQHAHEKGMIHRDIKPANLIRVVNGNRHVVKILDFGLAKVTSVGDNNYGLTGEGRMLGTPDYIAPEQITDAQSADIRADIYSLGCTLYFLITGRPPFEATKLYELLRKQKEEDPRSLNLIRPDVSVELAGVVSKMMAKDPARRYQTPAEVAKALAPFAKPCAASAKPEWELSQVGVPAAISNRTITEGVAPVARTIPQQVPQVIAGTPPIESAAHAWETLIQESSSIEAPALQTNQRRLKPVWLWPAVAAGTVVALLIILAALDVFVNTSERTIVLENLPTEAEVTVDGGKVTVKRTGEKTAEIRLDPTKKHWLEVKVKGFKVFIEEIDAGGRKPVIVRWVPLPPSVPQKPPESGDSARWLAKAHEAVAALANNTESGDQPWWRLKSICFSAKAVLAVIQIAMTPDEMAAEMLATESLGYINEAIKSGDALGDEKVKTFQTEIRDLIGTSEKSILSKYSTKVKTMDRKKWILEVLSKLEMVAEQVNNLKQGNPSPAIQASFIEYVKALGDLRSGGK